MGMVRYWNEEISLFVYAVKCSNHAIVIYADNGPNGGFGAMSTGCEEEDQISDQYNPDKLNVRFENGASEH